MNKHLTTLLLIILAALAFVWLTPRQATAENQLGASGACNGCVLKKINGFNACMQGDKLHICENNFPDANFRAYVTDLMEKDAALNKIEAVSTMNCELKEIASLRGVEFFSGLRELNCSFNRLTSLNMGGNPALEDLSCFANQLTSLNLGKNPALRLLDCNSNQLSSLDVSKNRELETLACSWNRLDSLNVSGNPLLKYLYVYRNRLKSLDVRGNPLLYWLECDLNQLTSLDTGGNQALGFLFCGGNRLRSLDVSGNTALEILSCDDNQLASLDLSRNNHLTMNNEVSISNQRISCPGALPGKLDLAYLLGKENLARVVSVGCDLNDEATGKPLVEYDSKTGMVSLKTDKFYYDYDSGNRKVGIMRVNVTIIPSIPGDINGDEKVNIFDVIRLLKKVTGEEVYTLVNTDINGDGRVNIFDVIRLLKKVTGENVELY